MNSAIEASILEQPHRLDENRKAEVLDFVEYLSGKTKAPIQNVDWPALEPARDLAPFLGTMQLDQDAVAYQRNLRDSEWA